MTKKILLSVVAIIAVVLLAIGGFYLKVALSGPIGQGQGEINKNQASNWTAAQAKFEDLYAGIQAKDQTLDLLHEQAVANPNDKTAQQTYTGVASACKASVAEYNADSRKFMAADFKAIDLPVQIDTADPRFDCKENTK